MNESALMVQEIGQKVAMHAVAMKPRYLSPETVPAEALEGEAAHVTGIAWGEMHAPCLLLAPKASPYLQRESSHQIGGGGSTA